MMMKEISLHILDIVQNSIAAGGTLMTIRIWADSARDRMGAAVEDNGRGMDEAMRKSVVSPFTTTRTTRKVGLGIPFFKAGAEACDGAFSLSSEVGKGTLIAAEYRISHIDRPPLGDMAETMFALVICNPKLDFVFEYKVDSRRFLFDTREIRGTLGEQVPLNQPEVAAWIREYLNEGIEELNGGV